MVTPLVEKLAAAAGADDRPRAGYLCSYTPVEILIAAGYAPYRLEPRQETGDRAVGFLSPNLCSYVRTCLSSALAGGCGDLAAVVITASCTGMMHLYSAWTEVLPAVPVYILDVPRQTGASAAAFFAARLRQLACELGLAGGEAGEQALREVAATCDRARRLLYSLCGPPSALAAAERRAVLRAALSLPYDRLASALKECGEVRFENRTAAGPTVLVTGCKVPDTVVFLSESCGVRVVDETCSGLRPLFFEEEAGTTPGGDPFLALARKYLGRAPCPRMSTPNRLRYLLSLIEKHRVDGVIYFALKFCDFALHEFPQLRTLLDTKGIPVILLEGEYALAGTGQARTRIEAFLELLGAGGGSARWT